MTGSMGELAVGADSRRSGFLVAVLGVLCLAAAAHAENIGVTPEDWDFGGVPVGDSAAMTLTMSSLGPTPLMIMSVDILNDPTGAFSVADLPTLPPELPAGESIEREVFFEPPSVGPHEGQIRIVSNDREDPIWWAPLSGLGLVPEPSTTTLLLTGMTFLGLVVRRRRRDLS
jgi:hypothetical protein